MKVISLLPADTYNVVNKTILTEVDKNNLISLFLPAKKLFNVVEDIQAKDDNLYSVIFFFFSKDIILKRVACVNFIPTT